MKKYSHETIAGIFKIFCEFHKLMLISFSVAVCVFLLLYGTLTDRIDRRRL